MAPYLSSHKGLCDFLFEEVLHNNIIIETIRFISSIKLIAWYSIVQLFLVYPSLHKEALTQAEKKDIEICALYMSKENLR